MHIAREKLDHAVEFCQRHEEPMSPVKILSPVNKEYLLSPVRKTDQAIIQSPDVIINSKEDVSLYKSVLTDQNDTSVKSDNLSMKTANDTLNLTESKQSFEISKEEEEEEKITIKQRTSPTINITSRIS